MLIYIQLFILTNVVSSSIHKPRECPPKEVTTPCKCNHFENEDTGGTDFEIYCENSVVNNTSFRSVFKKLSIFASRNEWVKSLYSLRLENTAISSFDDIFNGFVFENVDLFNNKQLINFKPNATSSMSPKITLFSFQRSPLKNARSLLRAIGNLHNLETLILSDNKIPKIYRNTFSGRNHRRLQTIELRDNNITELQMYSFNELPNVSSIDLDFNHISMIRNNTFVFNRKVNYILNIRLQNNNLTAKSFQIGSFASIAPILFLYLNNNQITHFEESVFKPMFDIKNDLMITAWNNPFRCDCKMRWLLENKIYLERITGIVCEDKRHLWSYQLDELKAC